MQPILIAYATTEGQTRKIAEYMAERLRMQGHRVDLVDTATPAAQEVQPLYQSVILGGSLHEHRHQSSLVHFIKANKAWLATTPVGFFSVSLTAALDDMDSRLEVRRLLDDFLDECELNPVATRCIAGALKYTRYDYFKRLIMRMIARQKGQTTDTSRDHEYTDWKGVEAFIDEFMAAATLRDAVQAA